MSNQEKDSYVSLNQQETKKGEKINFIMTNRKAQWILLNVICLLLTIVFILCSYQFLKSYKPGIFASTFVWAIFWGIVGVAWLPPKVVSTLLGGLIGISLSQISTGAGLISKVHENVKSIAFELCKIVNSNDPNIDNFITQLIWLFIGIISIMWCYNLFFLKE